MPRRAKQETNRPLAIRLTPAMHDVLQQYADSRSLSVSEAARTVLGWALEQLTPEHYASFDVMQQNARAEWIGKVSAAWRAAMEAVINAGLED